MSDKPIPGGQHVQVRQMLREARANGVTRPVLLAFAGPAGLRIAAELGRPPGLIGHGDELSVPAQVLSGTWAGTS
jgi:hypothetical protein